MQNSKLISLEIKNFGPFARHVRFDTNVEITKKERLEENNTYIADNNKKYNKVSYIYGANGVGKSNFCKAIKQIQIFLMLSPLFASNNSQLMGLTMLKNQSLNLSNPFLFDKEFANKPTVFSIEVLIKSTLYTYTFSTLDGKIMSEKLYKKNKRSEIILDRDSPENSSIILKSEFKDFEKHISVVKDNVLCLSMAAFLNIELANDIMAAIHSIEVVNMASINNFHGNEENCTTEKIGKYLKILKKADPTLKNIKVSFDEKQEEKSNINVADIEGKELVFKKVKIDITSTHSVFNNDIEEESAMFPFLEIESMGTIKLFSILPVIFDTLDSGGTLVIDEIDNGLHPKLIKNIIELFYDIKTNPLNAQLIVTSHCKELIDKNIRRDQVWIISKNDRGISTIKRVSDIPGLRAYEENGSKYLEEAFADSKFIFDLD